jgi:circadian clock protein KaiB
MTSAPDMPGGRFEGAQVARDDSWYELTLVVSGASSLSVRAVTHATNLCLRHLAGHYHLSVLDLSEAAQPVSVLPGRVLAAPSLIKRSPLPVQTFFGDLSQVDKVLLALGLPTLDVPNAIGELI